MSLRFHLGQKAVEKLFPVYFYQKKCVSLKGFEKAEKLEKNFRKNLVKSLRKSFPAEMPTVCCCVREIPAGYQVVLTLHSREGSSQVIAEAEGLSSALANALERVAEPGSLPPFRRASSALALQCRECSVKKAHRLVNRSYNKLNPFRDASLWGYLSSKFKH